MENILSHHGVKGMKWGVRKDRKKSSRVNTHRQKVVDTAKKSGMTQEEAEEYAAKRARRAGKRWLLHLYHPKVLRQRRR